MFHRKNGQHWINLSFSPSTICFPSLEPRQTVAENSGEFLRLIHCELDAVLVTYGMTWNSTVGKHCRKHSVLSESIVTLVHLGLEWRLELQEGNFSCQDKTSIPDHQDVPICKEMDVEFKTACKPCTLVSIQQCVCRALKKKIESCWSAVLEGEKRREFNSPI